MGFAHVWDSWNVVWISHSDHSGVLKIANHQLKPAIGCNSHLVYGKEYWVLKNPLLRETCCHPSKVPKQYANSEQPASGSKSTPKMPKLQSPGDIYTTYIHYIHHISIISIIISGFSYIHFHMTHRFGVPSES